MKKIVIIGASELQNPLIIKAKDMGLETHVFAWQDGSIGERTADYFYPISITEKDKILEKCYEIKPDAIATIASDLANITVNYLAHKLGHTTNSERSIIVSTNKYEMRKAFKKAGIPAPLFFKAGADDNLDHIHTMNLPIIVKPTDRSGSRSVTKLESFDGLEEAVSRSINDSFENKAIIEEFIDGDEYSCECVSFEGVHHMLAVTKKYTTGAPHFIETGHLEPSDLDDQTIERVKTLIFKALDALDIRYGASHSEFKVDRNGNINIIEIGSRMGGGCIGSDLVRLSTGYDFVKMVIQIAFGQPPCFEKVCAPKTAFVKFVLSKEDYDFFEQIRKSHPDILYRHSEIKVTDSKVIDDSSRYGFYIVADSSREKLLRVMEL